LTHRWLLKSHRRDHYRWRTPDGDWYPNGAWRLGFVGGYTFEENGARNLGGYSGFSFYATGVTLAMDTRIIGEASAYMGAFVDSNGNPLDGGPARSSRWEHHSAGPVHRAGG
jgi:hypothetical protein